MDGEKTGGISKGGRPGVLLYLKAVYTLPLCVLWTIFVSLACIAAAYISPEMISFILRWWGRVFLFINGVKLEVEGTEHVLSAPDAVLTANHASMLDILALAAAVPAGLSFVAKNTLFRIPIFGQALRAIDAVSLDRNRYATVRDSFEKAKKLRERKIPLVFFPEGTRTRNGEMLPFKRGAFKFAHENGLPVIPVVIIGSYNLMPPKRLLIRGGKIRVRFLEPVRIIGEERQVCGEVANNVREMIRKELGKEG